MTAAKLLLIWAWFTTQVLVSPCLDTPTMRVADIERPGIAGTYEMWTHTITVEPGTPRYVAVHEMAHHYFNACGLAHRPVGRLFLRVTGYGWWSHDAAEDWATTFTWVLTGSPQGGVYRVWRGAARSFDRILAREGT